MARFTWLGAALLAVALGSHANAQAVISEPGYCAQFYPNANCQNKGPGNPYTTPTSGPTATAIGKTTMPK
jgi:hypothetical protein